MSASSSSASSTVYLVTGADHGIGLGLVARILATHADTFVYAGAHEPARAEALGELQARHPARMAVVKCVSADVAGNVAIARAISARHGRVDTIIANAGMFAGPERAADASPAVLEEHFYVNVVGTIVLFQALCALLQRSACPRFVTLSAPGGCIAGETIQTPAGTSTHGASKAALNWATRKMHFENEWLVVFPLSLGPGDTEMVQNGRAADRTGVSRARVADAPPASTGVVAALLAVVDSATREKQGGEFVHVNGTHIAW
ncbi:hypothetical protein HYPSUDRAFT_202259 [Hypholoma sublateritium FD-334 SS-4]|uniref:Ketoreductase (KR) domain-containing protein n=1 Tax=Hypholoma sublateritium (strain FD-334 SS-4) TaxID=945553 RepID=A0A0D2PQX0_HYPSF|nr:hypothetical protein HYPSUDRAFT_202259 [Hypholoma sublateritium FD-334 SS-4]